MKKMFKMITIFLALVIVLSFAGCEKDTEKNPTTNTTISTNVTEDNTTKPTNKPTENTEPTHVHQYAIDKIIAATCTGAGRTVYVCECGDRYEDDYVEATGHKWSNWVTVKEPTTAADGKSERTCTKCGKKESKELPKIVEDHTHKYTSKVTKAATCTAEGVKTFTCTCGDSYTESIAKTNHSYKSTVTSATCTDKGYTTYTCANCKHSYTDKFVDAKGHNYTDTVIAATCTNGGYTNHTCKTCGHKYTDSKTNAKGHSWSGWTTTKEPTTTSTGIATRKCTACGKTETKTLDKIVDNHKHSYTAEVTKSATCTAAGVKTYMCSCGDTYTESIAKLGHNYKATVVAPTCTEQGYTKNVCSRCNDSYKNSYTNAKGHSYSSKVTKAATCTTKGIETYTCASCKHSYTKEIAATGHNYTSKVTKQPTCSADGVKTYTCSKCNGSYTESIAKLSHNYSATVVKPTCTEKGYTKHTCKSCSHSYNDTYTNATGHSYTSKVTKAATCSAAGVKTFTCSKCGHSYTESIAKLNHKYTSKVTAPTCTAKGYTTYTCSNCGDIYKGNEVAATGHKNTYTETTPGNCSQNGYVKTICGTCKTVISTTKIPATGNCRFTTTMRMDKAVHALWEKGIYTYNAWGGYTDWNVEVCSGCGDINLKSLRFAYTDRQAAEIMMGYVNDLREEVYGTDQYNVVIDETLIELAKIRAKELSKNYAHGGTFTNASENIYEDIGIYGQFDAWLNSSGHYKVMVNKKYKYFGYAVYADYSQGYNVQAKLFGVQLFWDDIGRDGYWMLQ